VSVCRSACEVLITLACQILRKFEFSRHIFKTFMKILPVGAELLHADGQRVGRTDSRTDRQSDGQTVGRTDRGTDRQA